MRLSSRESAWLVATTVPASHLQAAMLQVMAVARALVSSDEDVLEASTPHAVGQGGADEGRLWSPEMRAHTKEAFGAAPQFLMLDFRRAAISCRGCCMRQ